jgi:hypothetical protein
MMDTGVMTKSLGLQSAYGHTYEGSVRLFYYMLIFILLSWTLTSF